MFKTTLWILITGILVTACMGKKEKKLTSSIGGNEKVEVVDIDKAKHEKMLLYSSFLEEPDVIVLETNSNCVIQNICTLFYISTLKINDLRIFSTKLNCYICLRSVIL